MKLHLPFPHYAQTRYIHLNTSRCKACWACVSVCPQQVFGKVNYLFHRHARIDEAEKCKGCLKCIKACQDQAISTTEKIHDNLP